MKKQTLTIVILLATLFLAIAQIQFNPHIASSQSTPAKTSQNSTAPEPTPPNAMIAGLQKVFDSSKPYLRGIIEAHAADPYKSAPKVSILSIAENQAFNSGNNITLRFSVNQPSNCSYSINGQEETAIAGNTTLTGLPAGNQSLVVYAQNIAGKVGNSQPVNFTVTQPIELDVKPLPNAIPVTVIDTVAGACLATALGLTIAAYCWRRKK
jgi:hypothetical protein